MKLIVLTTLFVLVSSDNLDRETNKLSQAIEYGLPFNVEVIPNRFTDDSKTENKPIKITDESSSSTSNSFKNKATSSSGSRFESRPSGQTLQDLPKKDDTSFISDNTAFTKVSNRIKSGENKNKVKTFESEATKDRPSNALHKPELSTQINGPGINDEAYNKKPSPKEQRIKSNLRLDTLDSAPHFDDGSYKPELYETNDQNKNCAPGFNDGLNKHEAFRDAQRIKSNLRLDTFDSASHFDDGLYKPELYKIDHKFYETGGPGLNDEQRINLRLDTFDSASHYDDGSYKPELYKIDHKFYETGAPGWNDGQRINLRLDTFDSASHFDDGSYRPELYKIIDHRFYETGAPSLKDEQRIKSNLRLDTFDSASHFDDGSYKPELYKIDHKFYETGGPGLNDEQRVNLRLDTFDSASHFDDGSYKPELYKIIDHRFYETGAPSLKEEQRIKSNLRLDTSASHFDDGSYKPELYKIIDHKFHEGGAPGWNDGQRINLRLDTFDSASHFDDGSYRPELYKKIDHKFHGSGAPGWNDGQRINLRLDTFDSASHFDDGSYRPELYKIIDHKFHESGAPGVAEASYRQETFVSNPATRADSELRRTEASHGKLDDNLNLKLHSEYGVPTIYKTSFTDNAPSPPETFKKDDGSYKPDLYERIDQQKADGNEQIIKTAQHHDAKPFDDGSYKQTTSHKSFSSSSRKESSFSSTGTRFEAEQRPEEFSRLKQDSKLNRKNDAPEVYRTGFTGKDGTNVEENARVIHTDVKGWEDVIQKRGHYEYISPEGTPIRVDWIADHNGFRATQS